MSSQTAIRLPVATEQEGNMLTPCFLFASQDPAHRHRPVNLKPARRLRSRCRSARQTPVPLDKLSVPDKRGSTRRRSEDIDAKCGPNWGSPLTIFAEIGSLVEETAVAKQAPSLPS